MMARRQVGGLSVSEGDLPKASRWAAAIGHEPKPEWALLNRAHTAGLAPGAYLAGFGRAHPAWPHRVAALRMLVKRVAHR